MGGSIVGILNCQRYFNIDPFVWLTFLKSFITIMDQLSPSVTSSASRIYFYLFGLRMKRLTFSGRSRRPAKDPANALLNLSYAFLRNECAALLDAHGLDCGLGFLHGVRYGRESLALDVMEPFRPVVADYLVARLANLGMIKEEHFHPDAQTGFKLNEEGFRIFLDNYEKRMTEGEMPPREWIRKEIKSIRRAILEGLPYSVAGG